MNLKTLEDVKALVRNVPDFPVTGVQFKDLTTAFKNPDALRLMSDALHDRYAGLGVTKVAGIESRGFIGAALLAQRLGAGFVPIRKPGKLPADVVAVRYDKEYGTDTVEMHRDAITADDIVVIHDDLLATGGTMMAAIELVRTAQPRAIYVSFLCSIPSLNGLAALPNDIDVTTLFEF